MLCIIDREEIPENDYGCVDFITLAILILTGILFFKPRARRYLHAAGGGRLVRFHAVVPRRSDQLRCFPLKTRVGIEVESLDRLDERCAGGSVLLSVCEALGEYPAGKIEGRAGRI